MTGRHALVLGLLVGPLVGLVAVPAGTAPLPPTAVVAAEECGRTAPVPPDAQRVGLDHDADRWGVFCDQSEPDWAIGNTAVPSLDGRSLSCQLLGGPTGYARVHCYRDILPAPDAYRFTLKLAFQFRLPSGGADTCANAGAPSAVQALEFTTSTWIGSLRYELAVQWENVASSGSSTGRQWRWWDPHPAPGVWRPFQPALDACLDANRWYDLELRGHLARGGVRYDSLTVDGTLHPMGYTADPAGQPGDKLAVAVQLDGNHSTSPYTLVVDRLDLSALPAPELAGFAWYSDGSVHKSGPPGTTVRVYGTGLRRTTAYRLVSARPGATPEERCAHDPVPVNAAVRFSNNAGFVGLTAGSINRPPGTWDVCLWEVTAGADGRSVSDPVRFTVT
jgi:hypothetical protein